VCTPDLGCTGGNNDIAAGTDTDFVGAYTPTLRVTRFKYPAVDTDGTRSVAAAYDHNW